MIFLLYFAGFQEFGVLGFRGFGFHDFMVSLKDSLAR
jgi:hypothetical protein